MSASDPRPRPVLLDRLTDPVQAFSLALFLSTQGLPVRLFEPPLKLALGEIPFSEAATELYLEDPERLDEAQERIAQYRSGYFGLRGTAWRCSGCGERHAPQFGACWRCGDFREDGPPGRRPLRRTKPSRRAKALR